MRFKKDLHTDETHRSPITTPPFKGEMVVRFIIKALLWAIALSAAYSLIN